MHVHFIWWGPFNQDACESIETFTRFRLKHTFRLFCKESEVNSFKNELPKRVSVIGVDAKLRLSGMGTDWKKLDAARIANVLNTLDGFRTFAAAKDLLSLMILYRFGGLYLDTSCRLLSSFEQGWYHTETFDEAMLAIEKAGVFRVPVLHDQASWNHQPHVFTHTAITMGQDYMGNSPMDGPPPNALSVRPIDVWAMFGLQGDPMIASMIESYTFRAYKIGLASDSISTSDTRDVRDAFTNAISTSPVDERGKKRRHDDRTFRNSVAGGLIVRSVYDGLFDGKALTTLAQSPWITAPHTTADREPTAKYYVLPSVSILKTYGNSWR